MTHPNYTELKRVLSEAVAQAATGKGKERHAVEGERFEDQQICQLGRWMGSHQGPVFQAVKKALESTRLPPDLAKAELLGAINYLAAAVLLVEEQLATELCEERDPDEDMDRWLAEIADHCRCAPCCQDHPCAGVQQGSFCDGIPCYCDDDMGEERDAE